MRIALLIATLALGLRVGLSAHASVNEYQEQLLNNSVKLTPTIANDSLHSRRSRLCILNRRRR